MKRSGKRKANASHRKRLPFFKRLARRGAIGLISLTALVLLAGVALRFLITPEALKQKISSQLEKSFLRPVEIDHVSIVLHQGLKISGLRVLETEEFGGGVFLSSEYLIAKYKLAGLLRGRLELAEVLLMAPAIRLIRRADGTSNLQDMFGQNAGQEKKQGRFVLPLLHSADKISVERGGLTVRDRRRRMRIKFKNFELRVREFHVSDAFPIQIGFTNENRVGGKQIKTKMEIVGNVSLGKFDPARAALEAKKIRLTIDEKHTVELKGSVRNFHSPDMDVTLKLPALTSGALARYLDVPAGIDVPTSSWNLKMKMDYPPDADGLGDVAVSTEAETAEDEQMVRGAWRRPDRYVVETLAVQVGPAHLQVAGEVSGDGARTDLKINLPRVDVGEIAEYYADWKRRGLNGIAEGSTRLTGAMKKPSISDLRLTLKNFTMASKKNKSIAHADIQLSSDRKGDNFKIRISKGRYVAYANALSKLDVDAQIVHGDLIFKKLNLVWNESNIKLKGCLKKYRGGADKITFDGTVDAFKVDETYQALENLIILRKRERGEKIIRGRPWATTFRFGIPDKFPDLHGRLLFQDAVSPNFNSQNFKLNLDLKNISRGLDDVSGLFKIGFGAGQIRKVPDVRKGNALLNVLLLPFGYMHEIYQKARLSMDTVVLDTLDITGTYGDFTVNKGKVDVRYIHFDSPQFSAYADGTADFSIEKVDLDVLMRSRSSGARLPDRLVDTQGRPSIKIKVKNNLNSPTAEISLKKVQANDLEEALATGLKRGTLIDPVDDNLTCGRKL